jgi:maleylpyruvate isomerase
LGYLEQVAPTPPLVPQDPIRRAQAWAMAEVVNSGIQPLQNLTVGRRVSALGGDVSAWNRAVIGDGLAALEVLAASAPGPFLGGEAPSIADCCLVPQLYNARRFDVDLSGLGRLLEAEAACVALPAFQAAHPDVQPDAQPG